MNNNKKPVIKKIQFTKEEQEEIDKISKGQAVPKTKIVTNKNGYTYEYTSNRRFSYELARKRLTQLFGGTCTFCNNWPDFRVSYDVSDKHVKAKRIERYCENCYKKWKDTTKWKKKN